MTQKMLFSVYDKKAEFFSDPFCRLTRSEALRDFSDLVRDNSTSVSRHPEDYALYLLAVFENVSGSWTVRKAPEVISEGIACVPPEIDAETPDPRSL